MVTPNDEFVGCYDILVLGKSPIKWRQRPDMTLAVDWDVKHLFKQGKKEFISLLILLVAQGERSLT